MANDLEEQGSGSGQPERPGIVGSLTQRLQDGVRATRDALAQTHAQQLAAIVESSDDAIISKDVNGIVVTWNKGAERLFGYAADEAIGRPITFLFPPELLKEEEGILARIRRGERVERYETIRQRKDGARIEISLMVSPILNAAGEVVGASKIAQDITQRKRAESAQAALYDFTDRLFRAESPDDVFAAALDAITRALGCERASILLFDDAGVMKFVAWRGLSDGYRQAVEGHSPWTRDTKNPQPIFVSDVETAEIDAALKSTIEAEGIAALAFVPLSAKGRLLGKFMTYYASPHVFTDTDINLGITIARQLGFSLERMRAEDERRNAEEAKELLLHESRHRIKNTFATVQAMAAQTLRDVDAGNLETFLGRLRALGEAHELLTSDNWHRASLCDVIDRALKPFATSERDRLVAEGPFVSVTANTSLSLTMCLHELATNAVKYGALANDAGQVRVSWNIVGSGDRRRLCLAWQETGGPPVTPPERQGFGSRLIEASFSGEGEARFDFRPDGLRCSFELAL